MAIATYKEISMRASAVATASGNTGELSEQFSEFSSLRVQLAVTAASGTTPNLVVTIEDTLDGTNWNTVGTFAAKTAAGTEVINITSPFGRRLRVKHVITGTTPSFTFSVDAIAKAQVA